MSPKNRRNWSKHKLFLLALTVGLFSLAAPKESDARRRRRRKARKAKKKAKPKASAAIKKLAKPFKWGMTPNKVIHVVKKRIKAQYLPKIRASRDDRMKQDRLSRQMKRDIAKVKKSYIRFGGKHTGWDSSIVDDQFEKNNDESMLVVMEEDQQRFFFFHNKKLYKQMIAFNSDHPKYKGLTFGKFLQILMQVYGQGQPVFKSDVAGVNKLHHVAWKGTDNYILWALDKSAVYGNFCLVVIDGKRKKLVERGRKTVRSMRDKKPELDPLIQSVTKSQEEMDAENQDGGTSK